MSPSSALRLRFAPSPTGFFHVGSARTALFNWLIARQSGGTFVLRIEDTDTERNRDEWVAGIQSAMQWCGLDWDEGPFFQSQRTELYAAAAQQLYASGHAYYCDCSREASEARASLAGSQAGYDGHCRDRGLPPGELRALRFRTSREGTTVVGDVIRGEPEFENALIEDFVIQRGTGAAMFILANVVDDIDMAISYVVRGEEHLPNTPKAILLWHALAPAVPLPTFAHLPVLVNAERKKLSKRRDKVALEDYRELGILPEAMVSYLATLGWTPPGDEEIISIETMIELFRIEDVNASPAFFDVVKLTAFNAECIRRLSDEAFIERVAQYWSQSQRFKAMVPHIKERVKLLPDVVGQLDFLFTEPKRDVTAWDKTMVKGVAAKEMLEGFAVAADASEWNAEVLKAVVEQLGETNGLKLGKAQAPIRVAVTGTTVGPPLFEALEVLGKTLTLTRVRAALKDLGP